MKRALLFIFFACNDPPPAIVLDAAAEAEIDAAADVAIEDASTPSEAPRIYATQVVTPIFDRMELPQRDPNAEPKVVRLGYMRKGASAPVKGGPRIKPNCKNGWYELISGGFVCGDFATTALGSADLDDAPHAPFTDKPLPYDYGMSMGTGVPLYFRVPTVVEREKLESSIPISKGEPKTEEPASDDTPWFLKQQTGEKPKVSLDDLRKGGRGDLIERRMVKGFFVALDTTISFRARRGNPPQKFWRTARGLIAPYEHILVHETKEDIKGVWLNAPNEKLKLPLAWVTGLHAHKWKVTAADGGKPPQKGSEKDKPTPVAKRLDAKLERFTIAQLASGIVEDEHYHTYFELGDGTGYVRDVDVGATSPGPKPQNISATEKWIDVNLKTQSLVAYEGDTPVFATLVSSGRHSEDPAQDHHTPKGDFRIWEKHISATMEDETATDGPYSIEDVPWIMYFHGGYALHGAFWHSKFGHERSHGCINLPPSDAKALFSWTLPVLPEGWHGVHATSDSGTRVIVHE